MCSLSRALGLGNAFYTFARSVHTRRYRPATASSHEHASTGGGSGSGSVVSYHEGEDLNTLHMATTTSRDDYVHLLTLEKDEFIFASLVGRHIHELQARHGPCSRFPHLELLIAH